MTATTRTGRRIVPAEARNPLDNPSEANKEISDLLKSTMPDLPVPDLPPDDLVTLPGGLIDAGQITRTVVVRELTGEDEEALARATRSGNFFHYIDTLLERGTVSVGAHTEETDVRKQLKNLLVGDRDAVVLGIRRATYGEDIQIRNWVCPSCGDESDISMTLDDIPVGEMDDPLTESTFTVKLRRGRSARVRLANGYDQAAVFENLKLSQAERDTLLLSRCVMILAEADGSERTLAGFPSVARGMSMPDRKTILREMYDRQPGPRFNDIKHVHGACGKEVTIAVNIDSLFLDA